MSKIRPNARWKALEDWLVSKKILKRTFIGLVKVRKKQDDLLIIKKDED